MTDYAHTSTAERNRAVKARTIAAWCWDRGVTDTELAGLDARLIAKIGRAAGTNAPSGETALLAVKLLGDKAEWALDHPGHPAAASGGLDRPDWLPAPAPSLTVVPDPAPAPDVYVSPRGWDALVALGPLARTDAPCHVCRSAPVVLTPTASHCADHPPQPGQWGHALNWEPRPVARACLAGACWCGRCAHYPKPPRRRDHLGVVA